MEEKEKLISLSKDSWHYKLVLNVFNIHGDSFQNFCPYFWLIIAAILCYIPVKIVKFVTSWIEDMSEYFSIKIEKENDEYALNYLKEYFKTHSEEEMVNKIVLLRYFRKKELKQDKVFDKKFLNISSKVNYLEMCESINPGFRKKHKEVHYDDALKYAVKNNFLSSYGLKFNEDSIRRYVPQYFDKAKERQKGMAIIMMVKPVIGFILSLLIGALLFVLAFLVGLMFTSLIDLLIINTVDTVAVAGIIVLWVFIILLICTSSDFIAYEISKLNYMEYGNLSPFGWICMPLHFVIYHVMFRWLLMPVFKFIGGAFIGISDIFKGYFGAAYSDYCPGIDWDGKEEKK